MTSISGFADSAVQGNKQGVALNDTSAAGLSSMFLELLVAQISHQNPLDPMDGTQYVSQLAEFANVESLQSIKLNLIKNQQQMESLQALEATRMVGQKVDVLAQTRILEQPDRISGSVHPGTGAESVSVRLFNAAGNLVDEVSLQNSGTGTLKFEFPQQKTGGYYLQASTSLNGTQYPLDTWITGEVERVSLGASVEDVMLQVNGLGHHALLDIKQLIKNI